MVVILLTGTPGTGKTSGGRIFSKKHNYKFVEINHLVGDDYQYMENNSKVVDLERLREKVKAELTDYCVVEGHLVQSLNLNIDCIVIVLRTHPDVLRNRLINKGFSAAKLEENLEAEALDICLLESLEMHKMVFEIDTTEKKPEEVAESIRLIIDKESKDYLPGKISWLEEYLGMSK